MGDLRSRPGGRCASGQHITSGGLRRRLAAHGIPVRAGRNAALIALAADQLQPVIQTGAVAMDGLFAPG